MDDRLYFQILDKVTYFIAYRDRSEKEISDRLDRYLYKKKLSVDEKQELKEKVMSELDALGLIDDQKFSDFFIHSKLNSSKPIGKVRLFQELLAKGVSRNIVDIALSKIDETVEVAAAEKLISKKIGTGGTISLNEKSKLIKYLLGRGITASVVYALVDSKFIVQ